MLLEFIKDLHHFVVCVNLYILGIIKLSPGRIAAGWLICVHSSDTVIGTGPLGTTKCMMIYNVKCGQFYFWRSSLTQGKGKVVV